jgi:hypothetical protein
MHIDKRGLLCYSMPEIRSVTEVKTTPNSINPVAAKTGLSPEFHLAFFSIGKAGAFFCRELVRPMD